MPFFFLYFVALSGATMQFNLSMHVIDAFHYLSGNYPQLPVVIIPIKNRDEEEACWGLNKSASILLENLVTKPIFLLKCSCMTWKKV